MLNQSQEKVKAFIEGELSELQTKLRTKMEAYANLEFEINQLQADISYHHTALDKINGIEVDEAVTKVLSPTTRSFFSLEKAIEEVVRNENRFMTKKEVIALMKPKLPAKSLSSLKYNYQKVIDATCLTVIKLGAAALHTMVGFDEWLNEQGRIKRPNAPNVENYKKYDVTVLRTLGKIKIKEIVKEVENASPYTVFNAPLTDEQIMEIFTEKNCFLNARQVYTILVEKGLVFDKNQKGYEVILNRLKRSLDTMGLVALRYMKSNGVQRNVIFFGLNTWIDATGTIIDGYEPINPFKNPIKNAQESLVTFQNNL